MSLKRLFVPKSDVKQWFTTTTSSSSSSSSISISIINIIIIIEGIYIAPYLFKICTCTPSAW